MPRKSTITHRSGAEGPKHDPYHFDETTVRRQDGRKVTIHEGLGTWLCFEQPGQRPSKLDESQVALPDLYTLFEQLAGISARTAQRVLQKIPERRIRKHPCGSKYLEWSTGYPGEHLLWCTKCNQIIDSQFNLSEVI